MQSSQQEDLTVSKLTSVQADVQTLLQEVTQIEHTRRVTLLQDLTERTRDLVHHLLKVEAIAQAEAEVIALSQAVAQEVVEKEETKNKVLT